MDFLATKGVPFQQTALARFGCLERLQTLAQLEGGVIKPRVLEMALEGGHSDVAEWCLAHGAIFDDGVGWSLFLQTGLAAACKGFRGNVAALQYWFLKGAPSTPKHLKSLCVAAACIGSTSALGFAETLPSFNGWASHRSALVMELAVRKSHPAVLRWLLSRPTFQLDCSEEAKDRIRRIAVEKGDLDVIKALAEGWGVRFSCSCYIALDQGPSHRHVVEYIAADAAKQI